MIAVGKRVHVEPKARADVAERGQMRSRRRA